MEISYDIIIKYLSKNNNEKINFSNKKHIITYCDKFPDKFSNLLQSKFYKYGVTILNKNNVNISFYTSLLTLLNNKFLTFTFDEELEYLKKFKNNIKENIDSHVFSNYFENWLASNKIDKKDIIDNITYCIQLLSEILNINILIFDFKNKNIKITYSDESCNPWKPTIILSKYDELWEPIMFDSKRTFSYNDINIKKLLNDGEIEYYESDTINKKYILNENIKTLIDDIQIKFTQSAELFDSTETFIKIETKDNDEINTLNKKNKNELIDICKLKNIKVTTKMLKKEIIELILNN
jgi:hypothetical protein